MPPERPRRSSILKPPKARNPLSDLDLKLTTGDDDGTTFDRNKRVSFANTQGIALFRMMDNGNTIWDNFFEESNKINISESSEGSHSRLPQSSITECPLENDNKIECLRKQVINDENSGNEENISPQNCFNTTFSLHAMDTDDDDDRCIIVSTKESTVGKPENKAISDLLLEPANPCTADKTEELINFKIGNNLTGCSFLDKSAKSMEYLDKEKYPNHNQSSLNKVDVTTGNLSSMVDDGEMSITQCISTSIEVNNVSVVPVIPIIPECNISINITIPKSDYINDKENLRPIYDSDYLEDQEVTMENVNIENKRCTLIFDNASPTCDMSMTAVISHACNESVNIVTSPNDQEILLDISNKRHTQIFNQACPASDMSMTIGIPCAENINMLSSKNDEQLMLDIPSKRRTHIFDQACPTSDMSMTTVIPCVNNAEILQCNKSGNISTLASVEKSMLEIPNKRRTHIFDQACPTSDMSMSTILPFEQTINEKENIKLLNVVDSRNKDIVVIQNKRRTQIFDQACPTSDMSMTTVIPCVKNDEIFQGNISNNILTLANEEKLMLDIPNKRRTQIFDQACPTSDMSMTTILPFEQNINEKENIKLLNVVDSENKDMVAIPNKRRTQIFDQACPTSDMSMTTVIPCVKNDEILQCNKSVETLVSVEKSMLEIPDKRRTQIFDQACPTSDMSMAAIIPFDQNINEQESVKLVNFIDSGNKDMVAIPNKRCTQIFDQACPTSDMSMTTVIPCVKNDEILQCNKSSITLVNDENLMLDIPNKRRTQIFDQACPTSDMSMTAIIPFDQNINEQENVKLVNFIDSGNKDMVGIQNKRRTQIFDQACPASDMSMTTVIPCVKNDEILQCNISGNIPTLTNEEELMLGIRNKRLTHIFDQASPVSDMSMTAIIPCEQNMNEQEHMKLVNISDLRSNKDIMVAIPNKRRTHIFDQACPTSDMSITAIIPCEQDFNEKGNIKLVDIPSSVHEEEISLGNRSKRQTQTFTQACSTTDISIPSTRNTDGKFVGIPISTNDEELMLGIPLKRHTHIFDQASPASDMSITTVIPYAENADIMERNESANISISAYDKEVPNKFDQLTSASDVSVNAVISPNKDPNITDSSKFDNIPTSVNDVTMLSIPKQCIQISDGVSWITDKSMDAVLPYVQNGEIEETNEPLKSLCLANQQGILLTSSEKSCSQNDDQFHTRDIQSENENKSLSESMVNQVNVNLNEVSFNESCFLGNSKLEKSKEGNGDHSVHKINVTNCHSSFKNDIHFDKNKLGLTVSESFAETQSVTFKNSQSLQDERCNTINEFQQIMFNDNRSVTEVFSQSLHIKMDHDKSFAKNNTISKILIENIPINISYENENVDISNKSIFCQAEISQTQMFPKEDLFEESLENNLEVVKNKINSCSVELYTDQKIDTFTGTIIRDSPTKIDYIPMDIDVSMASISFVEKVGDCDNGVNYSNTDKVHNSRDETQDNDKFEQCEELKIEFIHKQMQYNASGFVDPKIVQTENEKLETLPFVNISESNDIHNPPFLTKHMSSSNSHAIISDFNIMKNESLIPENTEEKETSMISPDYEPQCRSTDLLTNDSNSETSSLKMYPKALRRKRDTSKFSFINQNVSLNIDASPCRKKQKSSSEICAWLKEQEQSIEGMDVEVNPQNPPSPMADKYIDESFNQQKLLDNISDISLVNSSIDAKVEIQEDQGSPADKTENQSIIGEEWISTVFNNISVMNLSPNDCIQDQILPDEWNFLLLNKTVRLRIDFEENYPIMSSRPIKHLSLECLPGVEKCADADIIHMCKALKNQLQTDFLLSVFSVWGDVPELIEYCAKTSIAARKWGQSLKRLCVNYGLKRTNNLFSLKLWNGYVRCIWNIEIKTKNLPFANPEDIKITLSTGDSYITSEDFLSIINEIELNWDYMKNLLDNLYAFVNALQN